MFRRNLMGQIFVGVAVTLILLSVVGFFLVRFRMSRFLYSELEKEWNNVFVRMEVNLAEPLKKSNYSYINDLVGAEIKADSIVGFTIRDLSDKQYNFSFLEDKQNNVQKVQGSVASDRASHTMKKIVEDEFGPVVEIILYGSDQDVRFTLDRYAVTSTVALLIPLSFFLVMLIIYMRLTLVTPLRLLSEAVVNFGRGEGDQEINFSLHNEELRRLAQSFVYMKNSIKNILKEMRIKNEELDGHRMRLAQLVRSRTKSLEKLKQRFKDMAMSTSDVLWEIDVKGDYVFVAGKVEEVLGYSSEEMIGKNIFDLLPDWDKGRIQKTMNETLRTKNRISGYELWNITKDGEEKCLVVTALPVLNKDGQITGFRGTAKDISEEKRIEADLMNAKIGEEAAISANMAKSEFLSNISHELRTPMHGILSFVKYAMEDVFDESIGKEEIYNDLLEINDSAQRLLHLLNDLLDLSKMEAGRVDYVWEEDDIMIAFDDIISELSKLASDKKIEVRIDCDDDSTAWFDTPRIYQVIRNILSNAIKFSFEGEKIFISIKNEMIDGVDFLKVVLRDKGVKIPDSELETVFDKFSQSSNTITGAGGTGLGLSICRQIISAHGGKIWIENHDQETWVIFTLPKKSDNITRQAS